MKKTLLIGSALVIGFAGFSQSNAKKVVNPKYAQKTNIHKKVGTEGTSTNNGINWQHGGLPNRTSSSCLSQLRLNSSWNPNGVGAGADCVQENALTYNKDLNALSWNMRASCDWTAVFPTSGGYEATIIKNPTSSPTSTVTPNSIDSFAITADVSSSSNLVGGRFPGGSWLNPINDGTPNTILTNAYICMTGPYNANATGDWLGAIYCAKPLWSASAVTHTKPTADSLYCVSGSATGPFGPTPIGGSADWYGAPNCDGQQIAGTNQSWSTGNLLDLSVTVTDGNQIKGGYIAKATISSTVGVVTWSVDSTSLRPKFYKSNLGYMNATAPRLAFGPDGLHGYAVYIGKLDTTYGTTVDSSMTPIVYKTTDGGATWNHVLEGYDWKCNHPEVMQNVGKLTGQPNRYYSFSTGYSGVDVTVDKNNVLHYVSTVCEPYHGTPFTSFATDSMGVFTYSYDYDYVNYHPIIWDFMTDGTTGWKTLMVDSLLSSQCNGTSTDTTSAFSAWTSVSPDFLTVGAHLTVSRSTDGSKVFYGWADSPQGINTWINNTNPDLSLRGYDVNTQMLTTAPSSPSYADFYNLGYMFFPYLADVSYYDSTQSKWVVPAVYTIGRSFSTKAPGFTLYNGDGSTAADGVVYDYTNCGTFAQSDFAVAAAVISQVGGSCFTDAGIKNITDNAFASSISNFPNPFNNTTTIAVTLTENKPVSIKVYNTIGDVVFTKTIDGSVGQNNVTFDGGQVSSGVYYYTVTAGAEQATKKMVIQK